MRYVVTFGYDGSKFNGFQRQKNVKSVQGYLENILSNVLMETIVIKGSGRTDAGVHAIFQVAHFDTEQKIDKEAIKIIKENAKDLENIKIMKVSKDFHARFSVKRKKYLYKINLGKHIDELANYVYQPFFKLDVKKMKEASKVLLGEHNYQNFISGESKNNETIIYSISLKKKKDILEIEFVGAGFYRYMVRNLVGALVDIGRGKIEKENLEKMLDGEKTKMCMTVPSQGLYLVRIYY